MDQIGPKGTKWTEWDEIETNMTEVERLDQSGPNRSNVD